MASAQHPTFEPYARPERSFDALPSFSKHSRIGVIGAGAFGGWTALLLLRKGFPVTLIDAWGAGNSRSSSGDETRVIRSTYGNNEFYFSLNVRALEIWKEHEHIFTRPIFHNSGVLWFCYSSHMPLVDDSLPFARKYNAEYEFLDRLALTSRFPLINNDDLHHAWLDPHGGYLKAREACDEVRKCFIREGGTYVQQLAKPGTRVNERMNEVIFENGNTCTADAFVFACGSWLPQVFPHLLAQAITPTRQEVYYFGVPAAHAEAFDRMPAWIDADGENFYYGIAGNACRGLKVGVDIRGPAFDPTNGDRTPDIEVLKKARAFLGHRFPDMKEAPMIESRVCPYENSATGNFIFDLLPGYENVFVLGGGSGHGFKHGPAVGELVADVLAGEQKPPALLRLEKA